jgi:hypothetical protein
MNSKWKYLLIFTGIFLVVVIGLFIVFYNQDITGKRIFDFDNYIKNNPNDNVETDYKNIEVNLNKWNLPITYKIIEIPTGENSAYICPENEIKRIDKAFLRLANLTDNALEFQKINDVALETSITFSCLGRNFEDMFYEIIGQAYFNGYNNPAFIEFFNSNDPYRNCLDVELHEILHLFEFKDSSHIGFNKDISIMDNRVGAQCVEVDKEIIDKLIKDYKN